MVEFVVNSHESIGFGEGRVEERVTASTRQFKGVFEPGRMVLADLFRTRHGLEGVVGGQARRDEGLEFMPLVAKIKRCIASWGAIEKERWFLIV